MLCRAVGRRRFRFSLRSKLIALTTVIVALVMASVTYFLTIRELAARRAGVEAGVERIARGVATLRALDRQDWDAYQTYITQLIAINDDIVYIAVYDDRRTLRAQAVNPLLVERRGETQASLTPRDEGDLVRKLDRGEVTPTPQDNSRATLAPPLKKEDGRIDWSLSAYKIYNRIRGLQPWPGAFTTFRGKNCQVWGKPLKPVAVGGMPGIILPTKEDGLLVICGDATVLRVEQVQLEGRNRVTDGAFMNGARIVPGERFGG